MERTRRTSRVRCTRTRGVRWSCRARSLRRCCWIQIARPARFGRAGCGGGAVAAFLRAHRRGCKVGCSLPDRKILESLVFHGVLSPEGTPARSSTWLPNLPPVAGTLRPINYVCKSNLSLFVTFVVPCKILQVLEQDLTRPEYSQNQQYRQSWLPQGV